MGSPRRLLFVFVLILTAFLSSCGGAGKQEPSAQTQKQRVYSFEGVISNLYHDGAGIIAKEGYKIGDPVSAKFGVDFQKNGYFLLNNGETIIPENPSMTNNPFWYFKSTLIEGTRLPQTNGGFNNKPTDIKEYHIGYYNSGPTGNTGALQGGTGDSCFMISKDGQLDTSVQSWVIGEHLKGSIVGFSDKDWSIMWVDLILKNIQDE